jgi:hypothetical protein
MTTSKTATGVDVPGCDPAVVALVGETRLRRILNLTGSHLAVDGRAKYRRAGASGFDEAVFSTVQHRDLTAKGWMLTELISTAGL